MGVEVLLCYTEQGRKLCSLSLSHPGRPDDHACPVGELYVVLRFQAPRYRPVAAPLLSHLQFLQQTEAARHHFERRQGRGLKFSMSLNTKGGLDLHVV